MTFFVPQIFTGIAFDSGGVASGPMTATFLLPLAMGACETVGGNILTDAFGVVAIMASAETRNAIMETVNIKHGLKTEAGAMICSVGIITWFVWDKISVIKNFSRLFLHFIVE